MLRFLLPVLWLLITLPLFAQQNSQQFDAALELYNNQEYLKAAERFEEINSPQATLFAGKSYFAATDYIKALKFLREAHKSDNSEISADARFTAALANFELTNFAQALDQLQLIPNKSGGIYQQKNTLYQQILQYLSPPQRKEAFQETTFPNVQLDLIRTSFGQVDYGTAKVLFNALESSQPDVNPVELEKLKSNLRDSLQYNQQARTFTYPEAPDGITYNIGIALPQFEPGSNEFEISRSMYLGFLFAAERFNQRNENKKVFLHFENTSSTSGDIPRDLTKFIWTKNVDAILGPLFSESVLSANKLSEQYQIPVLAPLANADTLDNDNPYIFQINPTFSVRGERMAEYAVRELGLDTLAIIADKKSLGAKSAYAFRTRAEQLGAYVPYLFMDDFKSTGLDFSEFSNFFATDSTTIDSLNITPPNAVYAPFTGQAAPTLIDLFLTDLESKDNYLTVLGSEEWGIKEINEEQKEKFDIYHTSGFEMDTTKSEVKDFRREFETRFDVPASRFSLIAYDTADYLFRVLNLVGNPAYLKDGLKSYKQYNGLSTNIIFSGRHVNNFIQIKHLQPADE